MLFAITNQGRICAIDPATGTLQKVFDTDGDNLATAGDGDFLQLASGFGVTTNAVRYGPTVLVANTCVAANPPSPRSVPQQTEIVRKIKSALFDSLRDFEAANPHVYLVTGAPSS